MKHVACGVAMLNATLPAAGAEVLKAGWSAVCSTYLSRRRNRDGEAGDRYCGRVATLHIIVVLLLRVLNLSKPKTPGQWIVHIVAALIALFLIAWLLRLYIV